MHFISSSGPVYNEGQNGIKHTYRLILTDTCVYVLETTKDPSSSINKAFDALSEIIGLAGDATGVFGSVAAELAGDKVSKVIKKVTGRRSQRQLEAFLEKLESNSDSEGGVEKIGLQDIDRIIIKTGGLLTGRSYIEIYHSHKSRYYFENKNDVRTLKKTINTRLPKLRLKSRWF